ncbi:MAG: DNA polymerase I, partial [Bacillota bacterium]
DLHGPTFRHEQYQEYKAGRRETPEDLRPQFPLLQELLRQMGINVCTSEGFEADDILGTFARMAEADGADALLVTGDKDALQLISGKTHVLLTKKGISETVEMDIEALHETYGLSPERMCDLKGLMGDGSDNIPGIPGVGEKTALKLLEQYGSIESVLAHAGEVKGKLGERIREHADLARMSYRLGIIRTDVPITCTLADSEFEPARMSDALPLLRQLQLNAIANRLPAPVSADRPATAQQGKTDITEIDDIPSLQAVVNILSDAERLALCAEGDVLYLAAEENKEYRVRLFGNLLEQGLGAAEVWQAVRPLLEAERPEKLLFDAKKWMHMLAAEGIVLRGLEFDAMIVDYLLNATRPTPSLAALAQERLGAQSASACVLMRLYGPMTEQMNTDGLTELYETVERPLIGVLFRMEHQGFFVDPGVLRELNAQFAIRIDELAAGIYEQAGENFNILSTKQLGAVLFEKLGLPAQRKTKTGYSTDSDVLDQLTELHPIVPLIQEYRFLTKLKSTFIDGLLAVISPADGRVHTSFNQNVAATGRISSTEPNLQNIPVRTALGREIRKAFVASPGNVLVGADYSQIELRLLAHISADEVMIANFQEGGDIHTRTAGEVFGVPADEVTVEQRSAAKAVNFGIVYGISDFGLSRNLGISRKRAGEYIERYLSRYPGVRAYMQRSVENGKRDGYVKTLLGRRRELQELKSSNYNTRSFGERVAMNMPIQGTAADIIKLAMVRVDAALSERKLKAKLVLQVHDELILDTPPEEEEEVKCIVCDCMQNAMRLDVPLIAEVRSGHSWYDTK